MGYKVFCWKIQPGASYVFCLKVNGKKLCDIAREGKVIDRKPREVEIYSIDILQIKKNIVIFDVECSKGTYIRTLCDDIGNKLGCGGHMSFLLRKKAGIFDLPPH